MKIGIISDTHGKLHPPVLELIASCDVVLHAGDVDNSQTLDQLWMHLKPNAPFYLVRGNNDRGWAERIAKTQRFCQAGVSFFMVHDRKDVSWDLDGVQAATGNQEIKVRLDYMMSELKRCQDAAGDGYLCGVPNGRKMWKEIEEGNIRDPGPTASLHRRPKSTKTNKAIIVFS